MPELNNTAPDGSVSDAASSDAAASDTAVSDTAASDTAASDTAWPKLTVPGSRAGDAGTADPAVLAILDGVRRVPGLPVSDHPAAYAGMHDALLEALNEEPLSKEPLNKEAQHEEPQHGPGAA